MLTFKQDERKVHEQIMKNDCFPVNLDAVCLSSEDKRAFVSKCASVGITPSELLEAFINDLICGKQTHGSDERMLASDWFDRRCFGVEKQCVTFLDFLLRFVHYDLSDVFNLYKEYEQIDYLENYKEDALEEYDSLEFLEADLNCLKISTALFVLYDEYKKFYSAARSLSDEMEIIFEFYENVEDF